MSYYIGMYGHIFEYGGRIGKEPPLKDKKLGFRNSFEEKDRAYYFRDRFRRDVPMMFINTETKAYKKRMAKKNMTQDQFRDEMRGQLSSHLDEFWEMMKTLNGKEYCDMWLRAAQYGFARAPSVRESTEEEIENKRLYEEQKRIEIIQKGINEEDFEE